MPNIIKKETDQITPRQVANKSEKQSLAKAIRMALFLESDAVRLNTQTFNQNRYQAVAEIEDYEDLKDLARSIKEKSIDHLESLIEELKNAVEDNGCHFYFANDKTEACDYIQQVCQRQNAQLVVKSKSMTSEEIKLNPLLENAGMEVVETDLAEFILQVSDEQPSHIVAPAIHRSRERISELFKQKFDTDHPLDTGEDLTKFAREILRQKFLSADIGISGANVIVAESGTLLLVESEGNIRMVTQAPPVHIAIAGVEKIVPTRQDLAPFIELLAPSGTGQPLTSYTNVITPPLTIPAFSFDGQPKKKREFHLVLIDNGRMEMRQDPELRQALYCIRCSACLNVCPNFQSVGGHAFGGETYTGGIGSAWEAGTGSLKNARFSELCTGCSRCVPQCPVRIDIPWLNTIIRDRLNRLEGSVSLVQKCFFGNFSTAAKIGSRFNSVSNWVTRAKPNRWILEKVYGVNRYRPIPPIAHKTLTKQHENWRKERDAEAVDRNKLEVPVKAVLFADVYTNYNNPDWGMATVKTFYKLGMDVSVSEVLPEGRASQSQGLIALASQRSKKVAAYLESFIDHGMDIIVSEPSVLALFQRDYANLLQNDSLFQKLKQHSFDPVAYLSKIFTENKLDINNYFDPNKLQSKKIFYHIHCQQKTINAYQSTIEFFEKMGFALIVSNVECCGMAGSFGYKKDFYELSKRVGDDLIRQIEEAASEDADTILMASGTSCHEQIRTLSNRKVFHPMELIEKMIIT